MPTGSMRELGAQVRTRRAQLGLSQQQLADEVGVARQWVLKLERGTANPTLASLWRALDVLGLALNVGPADDADVGPLAEPEAGKTNAGEHPGRPDSIDLDVLLGTFVEGPR